MVYRTGGAPLSVQHGQKLMVEGNTIIKAEGYGGSQPFDFCTWQKRWAWFGGQALPYKPRLGRRIWDSWVWENGQPTPMRGPDYCDQWNDAYWQSITDAGITMEHPTYERMHNPHINHFLLGPNTFVIGEDPANRRQSMTIIKAETDYPSHTSAGLPQAWHAYGPDSGHPYPSGPVGMQARAQCVVWPQEGHTFVGDWQTYPKTWTVGISTQASHNGLFNWQPLAWSSGNVGFKKAGDPGDPTREGDWAWIPRIHLLQSADVPNGYPDWWQSKRDPEAGNPAPDYQHMIVDVRNV